MHKIFITLSLFIGLSCGLFGQNENRVSVSLYAFEYANGHKTIYLTDKKDKAQEIRLSNANILGPFETLLDDESKISIRTRATTDEGLIIYPPIVSVKIPASMKQPLLVLVPVAGREPYKALVLDRAMVNFPKGSYKLINFSPYDVRGLVGKTKIASPAKKITAFNPSRNSQSLLDVHFQYKRASDWKTFGRTRWVNEQEKRSILCAFLDPITKRMKIRGLVVKPVALTKEKAQASLK
jgi:hypothetical protein